ncbi:MAG: type IX secretion system sortase PorU, partial [Candidatus Cloacimonadaceae bacterium]
FSTFGKVLPLSASYAGEEFTELPIQVIGEEDGSFDPSDYIIFYGSDRSGYEINAALNHDSQKIHHNPYSHNAIYWLTFAGDFEQPPLRITMSPNLPNVHKEVSHHQQVVHVEEEKQRRELEGYTWFMSRMFGSSTLDYAFDVNLIDFDPSEEQTLELRIQQEKVDSELTHSISVFVNGVIIQSTNLNESIHTWYSTLVFNFKKETSAFQAGNNRILIRVNRPNLTDNLFLDFYRVTYTRKLIKTNQQFIANAYSSPVGQGVKYKFSGSATDIKVFRKSSPSVIRQIPFAVVEGGFTISSIGDAATQFFISKPNEYYSPVSFQKLSPVDLSQTPGPIQSVIVTSPEFVEQANSLADMYMQNWAYHTKVVLLQDIFNQFNGGHPDPGAIRQYLKYVYYNAPSPALQGLTLIGLGTIDWRNYSGLAQNKNKMMIYQNPKNNACSDDYFAMLMNDAYPDIVVGRYPVSNSVELTNMLDNFQNYTQNPTPGLWRNQVVLLADDNVNGPSTVDWQHTWDVQDSSVLLNPSVLQTKIFAADYDFDEFLNKPKVRDALIDEINSGKLLWLYIGHGSFDILGMQDYFNVATDLGRLHNSDKLPLFIAASCEVSTFDHWAYESLGQKTVMLNNAGAIASVGATRISFSGPNMGLLNNFMPNMINHRFALGEALIDAKFRNTSSDHYIRNNNVYVLMGDPYLHIVPPMRAEDLTLENLNSEVSTLHPRQNAQFSGSFGSPGLNGKAQFLAYDSRRNYLINNNIPVSQSGPQIFRGSVSVENSDFSAGFFVPDDILSGNTGLVLSYLWDEASKQDYVSYYHPLPLSSEILPDAQPNESAPEISIYMGSYDFRDGDTVSTSPLLYAKISDENGINLTSSAGHNILLVIDNSLNPISVTQYFDYDLDSHTQGTLIYQMPKLSEGPHTIQIIAFDNQNLPQVAQANFVARQSGPISLENLLIYPNPMKDTGHITFIISEASDLTLDLFTMSGKRIRRIQSFAQQGFNQIPFEARDEFGSRLANNTYFIRVRAKTQAGKSIEKRERLVIYK